VYFAETYGSGDWYTARGAVIKAGYASLRDRLKRHFDVQPLESRLSTALLDGVSCLIFTVGPQRASFLNEQDVKAIRDFVENGGGLLLLHTYAGDQHHGANLNIIAESYGLRFNDDVVLPAGAMDHDARSQVMANTNSKYVVVAQPEKSNLVETKGGRRILKKLVKDVHQVRTVSSSSIKVMPSIGVNILISSLSDVVLDAQFSAPNVPNICQWTISDRVSVPVVAASTTHKVVAVGGVENVSKWLR
jgi:hypothetical protein